MFKNQFVMRRAELVQILYTGNCGGCCGHISLNLGACDDNMADKTYQIPTGNSSMNGDARPGHDLQWSYFHAACDEPLCGFSLPQLLETAARGRGDGVLYRLPEFNQTISARELLNKANDVSRSLLSLGIKKGDIVQCTGLWNVDFYTIMHGVFGVGAVFFHLYTVHVIVADKMFPLVYGILPNMSEQPPLFRPEEKSLKDFIETVKPKLLISGYANRAGIESILSMAMEGKLDTVNTPKTLICTNKPGSTLQRHVVSYKDFLDRGRSVTEEELQRVKNTVSQDDIAWMLSTTGTTGKPKIVCISHYTLVNFAKFFMIRRNPHKKPQIETWLNPRNDDLSALIQSLGPLYHWDRDHIGVVLPPSVEYSDESMGEFTKVIEEERITTLSVYPFWILGLLEDGSQKKYDMSSVRTGILTSQAVSVKAREAVAEKFPEFVMAFGATEFIAGTATSPSWSSREQFLTTEGYPVAHTEMKIVGEDGETLPIKAIGEICFRGWPMFSGYFDNTNRGSNPLDARNWLHTGDIGRMDETGHLTVIGRKSNCIRYKKNNDVVYPEIAEAVMRNHEKIREAAVIGLHDDRKSCRLIACIVLEPGEVMKEDDMLAYLNTKLLDRDCPDKVIFLDALPRVGSRNKICTQMLQAVVEEKMLFPEKKYRYD